MNNLLESLAALEHEQWMQWSKNVDKDLDIVHDNGWERHKRWVDCWKPYDQLTEEQKEHDRVWARKVLEIVLRKDTETKQ